MPDVRAKAVAGAGGDETSNRRGDCTMSVIPFAIVLIIAGLAICWLAPNAKGVAGRVFYWIGIIVAVVGALLFLAKPIAWAAAKLAEIFGLH
jgi:hypothetical protein